MRIKHRPEGAIREIWITVKLTRRSDNFALINAGKSAPSWNVISFRRIGENERDGRAIHVRARARKRERGQEVAARGERRGEKKRNFRQLFSPDNVTAGEGGGTNRNDGAGQRY